MKNRKMVSFPVRQINKFCIIDFHYFWHIYARVPLGIFDEEKYFRMLFNRQKC